MLDALAPLRCQVFSIALLLQIIKYNIIYLNLHIDGTHTHKHTVDWRGCGCS